MSETASPTAPAVLTPKDFKSDQDVRWCPGCGDYIILKQMQKALADLGVSRDETVFVSGIGCSSRFPYYMNTYGMHTIHGRAPGFATGLKTTRPELSVWLITGDGDGLSIGGNHMIHLLRRNVNIQVMLFNNEIYGLTKGQYSPTSRIGQVTKSSPMGAADNPFDPVKIAFGAGGTFIARVVDNDTNEMVELLKAAHSHQGTSFLEIYQNCVIYNDGAFAALEDRKERDNHMVRVKHGEPLIYGKAKDKGIKLNGLRPEIVDLANGGSTADLLVWDETDAALGFLITQLDTDPAMPRPVGLLHRVEKPCYDQVVRDQVQTATSKRQRKVKDLLFSSDTWEVS